jgi:fermentation-respiration switch protein FrsA (DUF1100 family)
MRNPLALLAALTLSGCTQLFFQPHRILVDTPARAGAAYQEVRLRARDGTSLCAWFLPAKAPAKATVLFLHGNAENISTHFASVVWMPGEGFNVLALDYRGYGASEGEPSLKGAQLDIDAAMQALLARPDVDPERIVIFGQSLGGALAIHYAAHTAYRKHIRALIADSAFSDYRQITQEKLASFFLTWPFQWLPWLTVDNDYSPELSIGAVSPIPLLLIHGDEDVVVPMHHSQRLFDQAREPKELWIVPGAGHTQSLHSKTVRERLTGFVLQHVR